MIHEYKIPIKGVKKKISLHGHFENLLKTAADGDTLVMTGDILNYVNGANIRFCDRLLKKYKKPYISVCGNHEKANEIPGNCMLSAMKNDVQILEFSDLVILGIDNSKQQITKEELDALKALLLGEKKIIIAMHVPVIFEDNARENNIDIDYFPLNHEGAGAEVFEFIDLIGENSEKIVAVVAGHLHIENISKIGSVSQFVVSQGATGNINRYEIGEL